MGNCVTKDKIKNSILLDVQENKQKNKKEDPIIVIEENFKIIDYTRILYHMNHVYEIEDYFTNYKPVDIRCVKGRNQSEQEHSHLIILFNQIIRNEGIPEVGLITDYSHYGFAIYIGEFNNIKEVCNLVLFNIELLHLPKADNQKKVSLANVIEWTFEHKDEQYMNPKKTPEFNMGKRIFKYITAILTDKKIYKEI